MGSASVATKPSPLPLPTLGRRALPHLRNRTGKLRVLTIKSTHSGISDASVQSPPVDEVSVTGAAYSFRGATTSLTNNKNLTSSKKVTLVRHGLSSWNAESRVQELWGTARQAWEEILLTPGENFLVVTYKSILRALICTALGLPPERFRAIDVNKWWHVCLHVQQAWRSYAPSPQYDSAYV